MGHLETPVHEAPVGYEETLNQHYFYSVKPFSTTHAPIKCATVHDQTYYRRSLIHVEDILSIGYES
jgi:hypothetical protein